MLGTGGGTLLHIPVGQHWAKGGPWGWAGCSVYFPLPKSARFPEVGCCGLTAQLIDEFPAPFPARVICFVGSFQISVKENLEAAPPQPSQSQTAGAGSSATALLRDGQATQPAGAPGAASPMKHAAARPLHTQPAMGLHMLPLLSPPCRGGHRSLVQALRGRSLPRTPRWRVVELEWGSPWVMRESASSAAVACSSGPLFPSSSSCMKFLGRTWRWTCMMRIPTGTTSWAGEEG